MEKFFIIAPPGFESETEREVAELWPYLLSASAKPHDLPMPKIEKTLGGLQIETEIFAAVQLNFFLKTASRILWRQAEFKARDFPKLHSKLRDLDIAGKLGTKDFAVKAAAQRSRLGQEKRIEETARSAWSLAESKSENPAVFIRMQDDVCTVSIDTSGEHLHRRGWNTARGPAPMRETLAAYCLRKMIRDQAPGILKNIELIDPMCGSGTLLTEAGSLWAGNFQRPYRFQNFRGLPKLFQQPQFAKNYKAMPIAFRHLKGFDIDEKVLKAAKANRSEWQSAVPGEVSLQLSTQDLLTTEPREESDLRWLISNPPYNERLSTMAPQLLLNRMIDAWYPKRMGLLWTPEIARNLDWPDDYRIRVAIPMRNGGIDTQFIIYER